MGTDMDTDMDMVGLDMTRKRCPVLLSQGHTRKRTIMMVRHQEGYQPSTSTHNPCTMSDWHPHSPTQ